MPGGCRDIESVVGSDLPTPGGQLGRQPKERLRNPLILGIALVGVGWATGGGAAQILFSLFGEIVFNRGPAGIGEVWGCAGLGLLFGGAFAHWLGARIGFSAYKRTISICYVLHGATYIIFSQMQSFYVALVFIALSRAAVAVSSVLNMSQLLRHVSNEYRGRVFATMESMQWSVMMVSMSAAGIASQYYSPRLIAAIRSVLNNKVYYSPGVIARMAEEYAAAFLPPTSPFLEECTASRPSERWFQNGTMRLWPT